MNPFMDAAGQAVPGGARLRLACQRRARRADGRGHIEFLGIPGNSWLARSLAPGANTPPPPRMSEDADALPFGSTLGGLRGRE